MDLTRAYAKHDSISTQTFANNSVDYLGITHMNKYNLATDISCKNVAVIAPAKWTMISKAVPNINTQNGIPPKKRMLFLEENYKKTKKR
jgi:hypothetical protein